MASTPQDFTRILDEARTGGNAAAQRLLPLVYAELRRLAGQYFTAERDDHTLQPTALVHEAFLSLAKNEDARWESRAHFYRVAAQAMRHVLVNHARDRSRLKRGGGVRKVPLDAVDPAGAAPADLIALDEAIERLAEVDPRKVQVVQLRYFGGFSIEDTARILDISPAQVKRDWTTARAFLVRSLSEQEE